MVLFDRMWRERGMEEKKRDKWKGFVTEWQKEHKKDKTGKI